MHKLRLSLLLTAAMTLAYSGFVATVDAAPDNTKLQVSTPAVTAVAPAPTPAARNDDETSFGSYLAGRFAESQGDTNNGTRFLLDSLKRDPNNKETLASLYRMYVLAGNIEQALPLASKLTGSKVVEEGSEFTPEMLLALQDAKQGHYEKADAYLATTPKTGFNSLLVPLLQAWLKLGEGQMKAPIDAKNIMPDAHLILPHIYLNAAFIDDIAGFDADALRNYEAAVKDARIEPFRAVEALANYYGRKGMEDKRKKLVDDYLLAHGDSFLADELLAESQGSHPKPLVADASQGLAEVFYTMANIFHGVRAPADEAATLHLALYLRPDFPAAQFLLASAYELVPDYRSAIDTYNAISKDSPYFVRGRIRSVYDESEMGDKDKNAVFAKLDAIAAERPRDIDALLAKGDILREQSRYKEAAGAYNEAAERVPNPQKHHWVIFFSRGACYERMGQWDKAEADMRKALELSPGEPDVLNYLGYSWLSMGRNLTEARKMVEEAYDARPEDAQIIDSMGFALYVAGDFTSAQEYFEQALERTPNDPTVNDHLGDTYWQVGRKTEARYQWERALADKPDAQTEKGLRQKLEKGLAMVHPVQSVDSKRPAAPAPAADE